jgi:hypothetical protein
MKTKENSTTLENLTFGAMVSTAISITYFLIANFLV